jgi:hypothetical protein
MNEYTLFSPIGEILSNVTTYMCADDFLLLNKNAINGFFDKKLYYVDVSVTPGIAVTYPIKPSVNHIFDYTTLSWVLPPYALSNAKNTQSVIITNSCQAAIISGVTSSALGVPHTYPTKLVDQQNLAANVMSSILPGLPVDWSTPQICANQDAVWAYVQHSAAQIQQVGSDVKTAIEAMLLKNHALQAQIQAAITIADVLAIVF